MHPQEFWWLVEAHQKTKTYGKHNLTADEADEIIQDLRAH